MQKVSLAAAAIIVIAGFFATSVQAADNPCKGKSQADCSADKACHWDTTKNKCRKAN